MSLQETGKKTTGKFSKCVSWVSLWDPADILYLRNKNIQTARWWSGSRHCVMWHDFIVVCSILVVLATWVQSSVTNYPHVRARPVSKSWVTQKKFFGFWFFAWSRCRRHTAQWCMKKLWLKPFRQLKRMFYQNCILHFIYPEVPYALKKNNNLLSPIIMNPLLRLIVFKVVEVMFILVEMVATMIVWCQVGEPRVKVSEQNIWADLFSDVSWPQYWYNRRKSRRGRTVTLSMTSADEAISMDATVAAVLSKRLVPPLTLTRSLALLKTVSTGNGLLWIGLREGL